MSKPSESELSLLRALWEHERMSGREIHEETQAQTGWSYSSTRKTLDRMVDKGLIKVGVFHGLKVFEPKEPKLSVVAQLIRDFSRNILDSSSPLPAAAFTHSKLISADEIEELEALLSDTDDEA